MMIQKDCLEKLKKLKESGKEQWVYLMGDGKTVIDFELQNEIPPVQTVNRIIMGKIFLNPKGELPFQIEGNKPKEVVRMEGYNYQGNYQEPWQKWAHKNSFPEARRDDSWEVKLDCVKECGKAPKEVCVNLKPIVKMKIDALMNKYKNQEWLGYYVGERVGDDFMVNDLIIPEQRATAGSVNDINFTVPEGVSLIGVVHSHHTMFAGFSGTDEAWINQNHNISTVVTHEKGSKTQVRYKTACGSLMILPGKLKIIYDVTFDSDAFVKEADEKINPPRPVPVYSGGWNGGDSEENTFFRSGAEPDNGSGAPTKIEQKATEKVEEESIEKTETAGEKLPDENNGKKIMVKDRKNFFDPHYCRWFYEGVPDSECCSNQKVYGTDCRFCDPGVLHKCGNFEVDDERVVFDNEIQKLDEFDQQDFNNCKWIRESVVDKDHMRCACPDIDGPFCIAEKMICNSYHYTAKKKEEVSEWNTGLPPKISTQPVVKSNIVVVRRDKMEELHKKLMN